MSTGAATPSQQPANAPSQPHEVRYEAFIEGRLGQARRQVKGVDIASGLLILVVGVLVFLLLAAVVDHWLIPGGLGFWGRLLLLVGLLAAGSWHVARCILPPVLYRINPIFAAHTIEQSRPSLKNSLINFLLLRSHRREVSPVVYRAIQHRAAADLSQVEIEVAVDRTHVIRLGYLLAAVTAVCCLYLILSPKSPLSSAARVMWPWARIAAPTRVTIEDVKPGDLIDEKAAYHDDFRTVSAKVDGLAKGEAVTLYYTTADGQAIDQAVPMTLPADQYRHECKLPPGDEGLQQDVEYYLAAGDYTTRKFRIEVVTAPAIHVDAIVYDYPAYTGLTDRVVQGQGDIRAIEGTEVTVRALANRPIKTAEIDFNCDGVALQPMAADQERATVRFSLTLGRDDSLVPKHDCYHLQFTDLAGRLNPQPSRHQIEVIRDRPPDVRFVEPEKADVYLAPNGQLEIRVEAEDPDFALRRVVLRAERAGQPLDVPVLLDRTHQGQFQGTYTFDLAKLKAKPDPDGTDELDLKPGHRIIYWAEAEDNKLPKPGHTETARRSITIVGTDATGAPQQQPGGAPQPSQAPQEQPDERSPLGPDADQPSDQEQPQEPSAEPQPGKSPAQEAGREDQEQPASDQQQPGPQDDASGANDGGGQPTSSNDGQGQQSQPGDESGQSQEPIDGQTNPGDAIAEMLEHREETQKDESGSEQSGSEQSGGEKSGTEQPGSEQSGSEQSSSEQSGSEQSGSEQSGSEQSGSEKSGSEQSGSEQSGSEKSGSEQSGSEQSGSEQSGSEQSGSEQSGSEQSGSEQSGSEQSGSEQSGSEKSGSEQSGSEQSGSEQSDSEKSGGGKSQDQTGSPSPQEANQPKKQQGQQGGETSSGKKQETGDSPSTSPKQSESQSDTPGDRSGGGDKGGGQPSKQEGTGAPGSNTEAESGGSRSDQQGQGETGPRAGDQVETDQQTGNSTMRPDGDGTGRRRQRPGGDGAAERPSRPEDGPPGVPQENPSEGGQAGSRTSEGPGARGSGNPTQGGRPGEQRNGEDSPENQLLGGDDPNLEYARKQTSLALKHLRDQLESGDRELLERMGWDEQDGWDFLKNVRQLEQAAARDGDKDAAARKAFAEFLRSLGLDPRGTELRGGRTRVDQLRNLREAGRFDPPPKWAEAFREYGRGLKQGR